MLELATGIFLFLFNGAALTGSIVIGLAFWVAIFCWLVRIVGRRHE